MLTPPGSIEMLIGFPIRLTLDSMIGFADPNAGIGYAYVTSQMGTSLTGDPRSAPRDRQIPAYQA